MLDVPSVQHVQKWLKGSILNTPGLDAKMQGLHLTFSRKRTYWQNKAHRDTGPRTGPRDTEELPA